MGLVDLTHRPKLLILLVLAGGIFVMQCPACRAVYSNGLELCPRCKTPATSIPAPASGATEASAPIAALPEPQEVQATMTKQSAVGKIVAGDASLASRGQNEVQATRTNVKNAPSTLIEFPGSGRASRPQWRKDLSERVREIQERRAREAAQESQQLFIETPPTPQNPLPVHLSHDAHEKTSSQLGLVPSSPDAAPVNPLVVAALRRIERARQSAMPPAPQTRARATMSSAATATAVARVQEEHYGQEIELHTSPDVQLPEPAIPDAAANPAESVQQGTETAVRARNLMVVPAHSITQEKTDLKAAQPRRIITEVIDDESLARLGAQQAKALQHTSFEAERPSLQSRLTSGVADFLVVAFASTPFAAIIEITNANWTDLRVVASMSGIVVLVMFLYLTASTALAGRTWGMSLVSLRAVDMHTGVLPTTKQSMMRAFAYILSLAACGLGVFYALLDAEGRTAHDHFSGTIVVRD